MTKTENYKKNLNYKRNGNYKKNKNYRKMKMNDFFRFLWFLLYHFYLFLSFRFYFFEIFFQNLAQVIKIISTDLFFLIIATVPFIAQPKIIIGRLSEPKDLSNSIVDGSQLRIIILVLTPPKSKLTKTCTEISRSISTFFASRELTNKLGIGYIYTWF